MASRSDTEATWPTASCCGEPRVSVEIDACHDHARPCPWCGEPIERSADASERTKLANAIEAFLATDPITGASIDALAAALGEADVFPQPITADPSASPESSHGGESTND